MADAIDAIDAILRPIGRGRTVAAVEGFAVPVDAGHILQFTRAIEAGRPEATPVTRLDLIAPPTFLAVVDHFDPDFNRRPTPGQGAPAEQDQPLFHVEQRFQYSRELRAGETLTARRSPEKRWNRVGRRGGALEFIEVTTLFWDESTELVASSTWVDVLTSLDHMSLTRSQESLSPSSEADPGAPDILLIDGLTRTQIVMYVGAAGDFHPLHHDDDYARRSGYPSVFAPGMLTMAVSAQVARQHFGGAMLASLASRFTAQVWPGDTLVARTASLTEHEVRIETINQHGAVVLQTTAGTTGAGPTTRR